MNNDDKAINILIQGILKVIDKRVTSAKFNRCVSGRIIEILSDHKYSVQINDKIYTIKSRFDLNVNEIVNVLILNNDYNNLYII